MVNNWIKPLEGEYIGYQKQYIDRVASGDLIEQLKVNCLATCHYFAGLTLQQIDVRYAVGKWNAREIIGHMIDTERILSYRALRIARFDKTELPGFEQDDFVCNSNANARTMHHLLLEFKLVRSSTVALIESFEAAHLQAIGNANHNAITVNAICFIIAGHELHHLQIYKERY